MSKFSVLAEDDESSSYSNDEMSMPGPQYSIEELLKFYKLSTNINYSLPDIIMIFERNPQIPELMTYSSLIGKFNSIITQNHSQKQQQEGSATCSNGALPNNLITVLDVRTTTLWNYKDQMDHINGPYPSNVMRRWLDKKIIDTSLLIQKANSNDGFMPISVVFPDISKAFDEENIDNNSHAINDELKERNVTTLYSFSLSDSSFDFNDITI